MTLWVPVAVAEDELTSKRMGALRVFLDCNARCDRTFLRREIHYVNYVRDRKDAQVHVLITDQSSASGREYILSFHGLEDYAGNQQTLTFNSSSTDTDDERRRSMARVLQIGLAPYVLQTPLGVGLVVSYRAPQDQDAPWNYWVFRTEVIADFRSEDRRDTEFYRGNFFAERITEAWRLRVGTWQERREQSFEFDDGSTFRDVRREVTYLTDAVKSIGDHWGAGLGLRSVRSTFRNLDRGNRLAAAVEYNLFPYSESAERQLTFGYFVGISDFQYEEETVFGLTSETKPNQGVFVAYDLVQRWGEFSLGFDASHFLDDTDLYRISLNANLNYQILRGLTVGLFARGSIVRDQIYLPRTGSSDASVLLGQRALDTNAETQFGVRLAYTFGSIYSNVVNNRLGYRDFTKFF